MKTFTYEMTVNGVALADSTVGGHQVHRVSMFGFPAKERPTGTNMTVEDLPGEVAAVFGAAYGKQRGVRITIEIVEPGEELKR